MNEENRRPSRPDLLEQATEALRAAPVPPGPPADLVASAVGAIEDHRARSPRRRRLVHYLGYGSLAATLLGGILLLVGLDGNTAAALDQAMEKVEKADAVRFQVTTTFAGNVGPANTVTLRGNKVRVEGIGAGIVWVLDKDAKAGLITQGTKYQTVDMSQGFIAPVEVVGMNVREQLLALRKQKAEAAGAEKVDDVQADKFVVQGGKAFHIEGDWVIWIGRESGLPVKVSVETTTRGVTTTRVYTAFDWAPKTDAMTFSIEPPKDFTEAVIVRLFPPLPPRKKP